MTTLVFSKYQSDIVRELEEVLSGGSPLFEMLRYHVGWADEEGKTVAGGYPGKLLRPSFCLMCCEAVGGDWRQALPAAASVELLHNFSLIHDDVEDCSAHRRHRRTLWNVWGEALAINAGDAMHTLAEIAMLGLTSRNVPPERVIEALRISNQTCLRLCEGQHLDLSYEKRLDITVEDYLNMIRGKTAALFECSFGLGALLGTENQAVIEDLRRCGHLLGLAFQIKDDVLGIWGGEAIGKSDNDLLKKKKTLPVVYALEKAAGPDRTLLLDYYAKQTPDDDDAGAIRSLLRRLDAAEYSEKLGKDYYARALRELEESGVVRDARESLAKVASLVIERDS
ncbi:MAG: polyprenyl synthetase family protein [Chloroflexi bacterium]|nr:polyprenyl synthetase family protein [Chloroflexota bacterium]